MAPYNGSGSFSLAEAPFTANTTILSASMNSDLSDIATGLSTAITKDGQTTITANLPMAGYRHTGVGNSSARTMYPATGQLQDESLIVCTVGGTANAITLAPTPAITAYATPGRFVFVATATNTGATTAAISGLAATDVRINGVALTGGEIVNGRMYEVRYDGTYLNLSPLGAGIYQGIHEAYLPAGSATPRTTNGAAAGVSESTTNKVMTQTYDFDQSTAEYIQFGFVFPKGWNLGTVTFTPYWTASSGSGAVVWGMQGLALSNDDAIDTAYGTAQTSTDTLTATGDLCVGPESNAITISSTPAAGDWVSLQVYRDAAAGGDTLNADAKLLGVLLRFTYTAANDA